MTEELEVHEGCETPVTTGPLGILKWCTQCAVLVAYIPIEERVTA